MKGKEVIRQLAKAGWKVLKDRGKGSHTMMYHPDKPGKAIIPHGELKLKTIRSIEAATSETLTREN